MFIITLVFLILASCLIAFSVLTIYSFILCLVAIPALFAEMLDTNSE